MVLLPKSLSSERGFIDIVSVLTLVVLLVGLVAGTYLVGQRQELRKLAALPAEEGGPPPEEVVQPPPAEQPPQQPPEQPPPAPPPPERECTASDCGCEAGFRCTGTYPNCSPCEAEHTPYCANSLTSGPNKCPYGCNPSPQGGYCNPPPAPPPPPPPPPQPVAAFCGDNTCNGNETCLTCPADCGACPAPQATQTPVPPLPGDYQSWTCPGPNCDKCGYAGWWASGCDPFIAAHPGDAPYASQRYSGGQLTSCGSVSKQCSSTGETKCGADTGYKETSCGGDGCFHETGGSCQSSQPAQLAQPVQPFPPQPIITGPCNLDEIQINCPNGEKICQNLITGSPQCAAAAPAPSTCANCLATARDPYECVSECNLAVVSKVGYDPTAITSLIDENQKLKNLGFVKETILPQDFKPYDPGDSELVKKYGSGSSEEINCLIGGPGLGAKGGCEPEALYLRDKYGVEGANKIIITKEAYKKTAGLGCGDLFNIWGEKCKDAFQAYTAAGFKAKDNEGTNTVAGLGTAFIAGLMGGPPGAVLFGTSDFLFSKTRLDEQETTKVLLEDRYGKGVIDVNFPSFLGSASTLAQRAGVDTSSLGSASRVDTLYRAYNSLITSPFIIKPVPASFDPREVTDPNEQARIIQEINKILTPSGGAGRVPAPSLRQPKEQIKNWNEVISLSNIRSGLIVYKDSALSSGYGQVYEQKNDEFRRELSTNLALDAATAGVGHVVGQAFKGAVKGAEETAVKQVVDDLAERRLMAETRGLASEAEKLGAVKRLISDAKVKGGEVVLEKGERLEANDVLLQTKFEQGLISSSDIKGIVLSGDEAAASILVKDAKELSGLSLDQLSSDALARRALENVDTKTLLKGLEGAGPDVARVVDASKVKPPPVAEVSKPNVVNPLNLIDEARLNLAKEGQEVSVAKLPDGIIVKNLYPYKKGDLGDLWISIRGEMEVLERTDLTVSARYKELQNALELLRKDQGQILKSPSGQIAVRVGDKGTTVLDVTGNGLDLTLPKNPDLLIETQKLLRQKYGLPPLELLFQNSAEYERELLDIAKREGVDVRPIYEYKNYTKGEKIFSAVYSRETRTIYYDTAVDIGERTAQLDHELVHALQHKRFPQMSIGLREVEAYMVETDTSILRYQKNAIEKILDDADISISFREIEGRIRTSQARPSLQPGILDRIRGGVNDAIENIQNIFRGGPKPPGGSRTGVNLLAEQGSVAVRDALSLGTFFIPGAVYVTCNTIGFLRDFPPCIVFQNRNIETPRGTPTPIPLPPPATSGYSKINLNLGDNNPFSTYDYLYITFRSAKPCNSGDIASLPSRRGILVCIGGRMEPKECLPGQIQFDTSGNPWVCGENYSFKPLGGAYITQESKKAFSSAEKLRRELIQKYNINLVSQGGYYLESDLRRIDALLSELPKKFYFGKTVNYSFGQVNQFLVDSYTTIGFTRLGAQDIFLSQVAYQKSEEENHKFIVAFVHELLHTVDPSVRVPILNIRIGPLDEFSKLTNYYGVNYDRNELVVSNFKGVEGNTLRFSKDPLGYHCSSQILEEFFACAGTKYIFEPETLKSDFPLLYDYYKNRVFEGKEYGENVGKEIIEGVLH